jgi:hypothetical protein
MGREDSDGQSAEPGSRPGDSVAGFAAVVSGTNPIPFEGIELRLHYSYLVING